jgi:hypothetical protein
VPALGVDDQVQVIALYREVHDLHAKVAARRVKRTLDELQSRLGSQVADARLHRCVMCTGFRAAKSGRFKCGTPVPISPGCGRTRGRPAPGRLPPRLGNASSNCWGRLIHLYYDNQ